MPLEREILELLTYSKCDCKVVYIPELGIVNGVCPNHKNSELLVDGKTVKERAREAKTKLTSKK